MNFKIIFIAFATVTFAANGRFCSFKTCDDCQTVLSSGRNRNSSVAKICRNIMNIPACCEKFRRCETLTGCITRFPSAFVSY